MEETYILRIFRAILDTNTGRNLNLNWFIMANIISSLMEIQRNPVNRQGEKVDPVVWESGCLEEVCGSCSMLINGYPRQACTALIERLYKETGDSTIRLAPLPNFLWCAI